MLLETCKCKLIGIVSEWAVVTCNKCRNIILLKQTNYWVKLEKGKRNKNANESNLLNTNPTLSNIVHA